MASLKQIAGELKISYTLVSKVLSGRMGTTGVSAATKEAILKKSRELNYRPNRLAVALKRGRKGAIGVFLHGMGSPGSELSDQFLKGVAGALEKSSSRLWLRFFVTDEDFFAACDDDLHRDVDGLVIAGVDHPGLVERLTQIDSNGLPVVTSFCSIPKHILRTNTNIAVDYEAQCYLTTKHLLDKGCRRIAHFRTLELRYHGFARAHQEMGVPIDSNLVIKFPNSFSIEDGEHCARLLFEGGRSFDGLVAESDAQAIGAVRVFVNKGLRVPENVRVTGVDGSPLAEACYVPLTTSTGEMVECGRIAIEMLKKKINGQPVESVTIFPKLIIRASSA